jgi:mannose-6-phosphate isomerase-like protein (cupin superfamily)
MIKTPERMTREIKVQMRGGEGQVELLHLLEPADLTGKCRLVALLTLEQGCSIGNHVHGEEEEIYYIQSGEGVFTENGQETILKAGDVSLTGNGGSHGIRNDRPEPLVILAVILTFT